MTTMAVSNGIRTAVPRRSLEELVDRLIDTLVSSIGRAPERSVARAVHDARRLRQAGDLDGALTIFEGVNVANAPASETRWAYGEWLSLVRRRFADGRAMLYSPATGKAAALAPNDEGSLEVLAVLGMGWERGKTVSRRSLRGLRALGCTS